MVIVFGAIVRGNISISHLQNTVTKRDINTGNLKLWKTIQTLRMWYTIRKIKKYYNRQVTLKVRFQNWSSLRAILMTFQSFELLRWQRFHLSIWNYKPKEKRCRSGQAVRMQQNSQQSRRFCLLTRLPTWLIRYNDKRCQRLKWITASSRRSSHSDYSVAIIYGFRIF